MISNCIIIKLYIKLYYKISCTFFQTKHKTKRCGDFEYIARHCRALKRGLDNHMSTSESLVPLTMTLRGERVSADLIKDLKI